MIELDTPAVLIPAFAVVHDAPLIVVFHKNIDISLANGSAASAAEDSDVVVGVDHLSLVVTVATGPNGFSDDWVILGPDEVTGVSARHV